MIKWKDKFNGNLTERIQTSDFAILVRNALSTELREKNLCVELFRKLLSRLTCEMKVPVDFHEDSNLRFTSFAVRYSTS